MFVEGIVLLASLSIPVPAGIVLACRVYSFYRLFSKRVGSLSYYWLGFQLQTPQLAKLFPGYVDLFYSLHSWRVDARLQL